MAQKIMRNSSTPVEMKVEVENVNGLSVVLNDKVDKIQGKSLSQNDYTNDEKSTNAANTSARHNHNNFTILQSISQNLINNWNNAFSHISDAVKHITSNERNLWNTVSSKGDMAKSVYDKNNDGIVDNSETVNGLTVLTAVPSGAKFTDTIYTHPNTHPYSIITGAPAALPPIGAAGGDLSGNYPNPTVKNDSHTHDTQYYTKGQINVSVTPANGYARSNLGNPSVTEMALIDAEATNKLWFYNPDCLLFEQTTDGTNWTTVSISNGQKKAFVSGNSNASIIIPRNAVKYRITVTNNGNYVYLSWLYIYMSTSGNNCAFSLEHKRYGATSWSQLFSETNDVNTWPGHVFISHYSIPFHPTMHTDKVRLTFIPTWSTSNTNAITLYGMEWWGGYPSGKRTIYGWDSDKNVTFPANVTAASFIGNSSTATKLLSPRAINGVNFDGTANITVPAVDQTARNSASTAQNTANAKEPAFGKNNAFNKNFGNAAGTVCQGDDVRLSDARPANGGNAATVGGKTSSEIQNYNNLTNKPIIPSGVEVINNLNSTSTSASLSANMGKTLNENKFNKPITSASTPSGQVVGDVWNQII